MKQDNPAKVREYYEKCKEHERSKKDQLVDGIIAQMNDIADGKVKVM